MKILCNKIRERIIKDLIEHTDKEDHPAMIKRLDKCYFLNEGSFGEVVLCPTNSSPEITIKYLASNGKFIGPEGWQYAVENGELVEWQ